MATRRIPVGQVRRGVKQMDAKGEGSRQRQSLKRRGNQLQKGGDSG